MTLFKRVGAGVAGLLTVLLFCAPIIRAQKIKGHVYGIENNDTIPLFMANVYWKGLAKGTQSRQDGSFELDRLAEHQFIVVQFIGYRRDTINVAALRYLQVVLQPEFELNTVVKSARINAQKLDMKSITATRSLNEKALQKAPCCNLAESFENTPAIDVSFTDALTGTRHIQMLGLAGKYSVISQELIPAIRGFHAINGLHMIPGPWLEGIQITKGSGPVTSGFESISGQINLEIKKPESTDPLYLNLYTNQGGRTELNLINAIKLNEKVSTALFVHANMFPLAWDMNKDGFSDMQTGGQLNIMNRWKYQGTKGLEAMFGVHWVEDEKFGGNLEFARNREAALQGNFPFATHQKQRYQAAFLKTGYVFPKHPNKSMGMQIMAHSYRNNADFGPRNWTGEQNRLYGNFIFQQGTADEKHTLKAGLMFQAEKSDEAVVLPLLFSIEGQIGSMPLLKRTEIIHALFAEHTFKPGERLLWSSGVHLMYNQLYQALVLNPRVHMRFKPDSKTTIRTSAGRGTQSPYLFTENISAFVSKRSWDVTGSSAQTPYGFELEHAWNTGLSIARSFRLDYREGNISVEYFYTTFIKQVVSDWYQSARTINLYQLDGRSHAHSFQAELTYELLKRLEMHAAYRYNEARTDMLSGFMLRPLMPLHRSFLNFAYSTKNNWIFDVTAQRFGRSKLPFTGDNPEQLQLSNWTNSFYLTHFQITKKFKNHIEIYTGAENAFNFQQPNPIVDAVNAGNGNYFDAVMIWAPIFGRMFFAGMRWALKIKTKDTYDVQ